LRAVLIVVAAAVVATNPPLVNLAVERRTTKTDTTKVRARINGKPDRCAMINPRRARHVRRRRLGEAI
jgi:hypothetical protein